MATDPQLEPRSKPYTASRDGGRTVPPGHVYRILSFVGVVFLTGSCLAAVGSLGVSSGSGGRLPVEVVSPETAVPPADLPVLTMTGLVTVATMLPLCKPRPRRILDTMTSTWRALLVVTAVVATAGYFEYSLRLPRTVLLVFVGALAVTLPAWFVFLQRRQLRRNEGTLIVGNNPKRIEAAVQATSEPIAGYALSPTGPRETEPDGRISADGGSADIPAKLTQYECLGGLSRLDDILRRSDVGTVVPALPQTDRDEFFGVLEVCRRHDVNVEILDEHDESVLIEGEGDISSEETKRLIRINIEPLDLQNRVFKRLFDVAFAVVGLCLTTVLAVPIAAAVKLDSRGPLLYKQQRTTEFGDRFSVYKFRTMRPGSESAAPGEDEDRITRVGRVLRQTHLDELPQLWAVLMGQMSVVGPRAAWTAEEERLQSEVKNWKKRWFVKPGLTGLAQINGLSSENSRAKLQYDLTYIRNQSFRFDLTIVVRQIWMVVLDCSRLVTGWTVDRIGDVPDRLR